MTEIVEANQVDNDAQAELPNEAEQIEQEDQTFDEYQDDQPEGGQDELDDSEDINFNGKDYKLPKEIADAVKSMRADYTHKTEDVAAQRREIEAKAQFLRGFEQEAIQLETAKSTLQQYRQIDWNVLNENDPIKAQQLMAQYVQLRDQVGELESTVAQKRDFMHHAEQQEIAKRMQESETILKRDIKEWSPELESKLQRFAIDRFGFDSEDVKRSKADSRLYKLIHLAFVGEQVLKGKSQNQAKPQLKPVTTLKARNGKVSKDPSEMNDVEFAKWRQEQIKQRKYR